jgi:hypothetical protein
MAVMNKHSPPAANTESTILSSKTTETSSSDMSTKEITISGTGSSGDTINCDMEFEPAATPDPHTTTPDDMEIDIVAINGISNETGSKTRNDSQTAEVAKGEVINNKGGDEDGDKDIDADPNATMPDNMDIDFVAIDGISNKTGSEIQSDGRRAEVAKGEVINDKDGDEDSDEDTDAEDVQGERVAKSTPAVAKAPVKSKPIRYLNGKRVSEYEWERNQRIEQNKVLLAALELDNAGARLFGKTGDRKTKENRQIGHEPSKKKGKKLPSANVEKRGLLPLGKAIPNRSVSIVINNVSSLTCPKC